MGQGWPVLGVVRFMFVVGLTVLNFFAPVLCFVWRGGAPRSTCTCVGVCVHNVWLYKLCFMLRALVCNILSFGFVVIFFLQIANSKRFLLFFGNEKQDHTIELMEQRMDRIKQLFIAAQ